MRSAAPLVAVALAVAFAACRRHDPPDWQPSIHPPPPAAPPALEPPPPAPLPPPLAYQPPPPAPTRAEPAAEPDETPDGGAQVVRRHAADGGTVNGHPRGPRAATLEATVRAAVPALQRCSESDALAANVDVPARVTYRILPFGRTGSVDVEGALPPDVEACVKQVFDGLRFAPFEGEPVPGALPLRFRRDVRPGPRLH